MRAPRKKTDWEVVAIIIAALAALAMLGIAAYLSLRLTGGPV
jgi:hypothetical protein